MDFNIKIGNKFGVNMKCEDETVLSFMDRLSDINGVGTLLSTMPDAISHMMQFILLNNMRNMAPQQAVPVSPDMMRGPPPDPTLLRMMMDKVTKEAEKKNKKKGKGKKNNLPEQPVEIEGLSGSYFQSVEDAIPESTNHVVEPQI